LWEKKTSKNNILTSIIKWEKKNKQTNQQKKKTKEKERKKESTDLKSNMATLIGMIYGFV
jgi:hypothetical protein